MTDRLSGRVAWITGCDSGIGRALALALAGRGATVIATCREEPATDDTLQAELAHLSADSRVLRQDVTREEHAKSVARVIANLNCQSIVLINNAGIYPRVPADELSNRDWRELMAINLDGAWYSAHAVIPLMKTAGYGKIIQIGSVTATIGMEHLSHYIASKMGLIGMTRGIARDLGHFGIRSNCVVLGAIRVGAESQLGNPREVTAKVLARQSLPYRLTPADVIPTFAFLASAQSDAITGQVITVDAGWTHSN